MTRLLAAIVLVATLFPSQVSAQFENAVAEHLKSNPSPTQVSAKVKGPQVCVRQSPPFVMKRDDGTWDGAAISLWNHVAAHEDINFTYVECDLQKALVPEGDVIASVGAFTLTAPRELKADWTTPYYSTSLGVMSRTQPWIHGVGDKLIQAAPWILLLFSTLIVVGAIYKLIESSTEGAWDSFINGIYWAGTTNTTTGYGDEVPTTNGGKMYSLLWQYTSALTYAVLIGAIAAGFTTTPFEHNIQEVGELKGLTVGVDEGSFTDLYLQRYGIKTVPMLSPEDMSLKSIDVIVDDRAPLQYAAREIESVGVTDARIQPFNYAFPLQVNSPLREGVNQRILEYTSTQDWKAILSSYLD